MRDYLRLIIVLAVISAVAAGALAVVDSVTQPQIDAFKVQAESDAYKQVLPQATDFKEDSKLLSKVQADPKLSLITGLRIGERDGQKIGWVCKVASHGYSSDIVMLIGIDLKGQLSKVLILEQNETPGLGTNVTNDEFIKQRTVYTSNGQDLKVTKDGGTVQAVTGATISSRAVLRGINQAFEFYRLQAAQS